MKVIIIGLGSRGDVIPIVALAKKIVMSGLNVEVVVYPPFKSYVEQEGINCRTVCTAEQYSDMVSCPAGLADEQYRLHHWMACHKHAIKPIFEYVSEERSREPLVVLAEEWCLGAVWACEMHNIPLFTLMITPPAMLADVNSDKNSGHANDGNEPKQTASDQGAKSKLIDRFRAIMKWPKKVPGIEDVSIGKVCVYPKLIISALIERGFPDDETGRTFLIDRDEIIAANNYQEQRYKYDILYTCGTAFSAGKAELEAFSFLCSALKKKGVFIKGGSDIPKFEDDYVDVVDYIDIPEVLENASLIIHHGGIGTTSNSVNAGVAQLIIPRAFDQFINAEMVESHGLGVKLDHKEFYYNSKVLVETAENILERRDKIKVAARDLQLKKMSTSNISELLDSFESIESELLARGSGYSKMYYRCLIRRISA